MTEQGLARTFQNIRLFPNMTVLENVMIGRHCRTKAKVLGALLRNPATILEEQQIVAMSITILENLGLADVAGEFAKNLPYGAQRRLEIARALATDPLLLLLDEPAAGMNPQETKELDELITKIRDDGLSILLIEHDMKLVMSLSDYIFVLDYGKKDRRGYARGKSGNNPGRDPRHTFGGGTWTMLELEKSYLLLAAPGPGRFQLKRSEGRGGSFPCSGAQGPEVPHFLLSFSRFCPPRGGPFFFQGGPSKLPGR